MEIKCFDCIHYEVCKHSIVDLLKEAKETKKDKIECEHFIEKSKVHISNFAIGDRVLFDHMEKKMPATIVGVIFDRNDEFTYLVQTDESVPVWKYEQNTFTAYPYNLSLLNCLINS